MLPTPTPPQDRRVKKGSVALGHAQECPGQTEEYLDAVLIRLLLRGLKTGSEVGLTIQGGS